MRVIWGELFESRSQKQSVCQTWTNNVRKLCSRRLWNTCLDFDCAADPFFLKTVTVSQSHSAISSTIICWSVWFLDNNGPFNFSRTSPALASELNRIYVRVWGTRQQARQQREFTRIVLCVCVFKKVQRKHTIVF